MSGVVLGTKRNEKRKVLVWKKVMSSWLRISVCPLKLGSQGPALENTVSRRQGSDFRD